MSKIMKEIKKLLNEAKELKGESYPFFPDGQLIGRAKGHLIYKKIKK